MEGIGKRICQKLSEQKGHCDQTLRMTLEALLIQKEYSYSDEEMILQIQETPYL
ncbi:hypothetical protein LI951_12170 [Enterococcus sp. BWT-B8]|uniref:hypothetical protein n=1 Tax=unclassified Enterococcus TaxID=2608891 RepID=UPI001E5F5B14|nr:MULTISPECIES: hypothetical protein [unclassified Enterococcus]MCB5952825.1 hypothetical protein [Enterococcus sp. BWT-B8]MCB5953830.1 hypothetical protein [Enterococcus sp. CWB-B31]